MENMSAGTNIKQCGTRQWQCIVIICENLSHIDVKVLGKFWNVGVNDILESVKC